MTQKAEPSWGLRGGEEGICCWRRAEGIKDMMLADEHRASPDQTVAESRDAPGPWPPEESSLLTHSTTALHR